MTRTRSRQTTFTTAKAVLAIGALAGPMLANTPAFAQYYSSNTAAYEQCERRDDTTQIIGGVLGGVVGGLLGNEIDKGDGTVGTVVGAGLGTYAGARLGNRNCTQYNTSQYRAPQPYRTTTYVQPTYTQSYPTRTYTQPTYTQRTYTGSHPTRTYSQPSYRHVTHQPSTYTRTHYPTTRYSQPSYQPATYVAPRHYPQPHYSSSVSTVTQGSYQGSYYGASSGQLQIIDPQTGASRTISQAEYDRYYRR